VKVRTVTFEGFQTFQGQQAQTLYDVDARTRIQDLIQQASPDAKLVINQVYAIERRQLFARDVRGAVRRESVEQIVTLIKDTIS